MRLKRVLLFSLTAVLILCFGIVVAFADTVSRFDLAVEADASAAISIGESLIMDEKDTIEVSIVVKQNDLQKIKLLTFDFSYNGDVIAPVTDEDGAMIFTRDELPGGVIATASNDRLGHIYYCLSPNSIDENQTSPHYVDLKAGTVLLKLTFTCFSGEGTTDFHLELDSTDIATNVTGEIRTMIQNESLVVSASDPEKNIEYHSLGGSDSIPATCTTPGSTAYSCSKCEKVFPTLVIPALNHDIVIDPAVDPTCTSLGYTQGQHCTRCDDKTIPREPIDMLPHSPISVTALDSTCSSVGYTAGTRCSVCNTTLSGLVEIEKKPHTEVDVPAKEPTCSSVGLTAGRKCSVCNTFFIEQKTIEMIPHVFNDWVTQRAATSEQAGLEVRTCMVCNYSEERLLDQLTDSSNKGADADDSNKDEEDNKILFFVLIGVLSLILVSVVVLIVVVLNKRKSENDRDDYLAAQDASLGINHSKMWQSKSSEKPKDSDNDSASSEKKVSKK